MLKVGDVVWLVGGCEGEREGFELGMGLGWVWDIFKLTC